MLNSAVPQPAASHVRYRPEVDGLRALAIVPVVLFHAGLGFPGGYVGVDVFFVISGYLITQLILKRGEFSLTEFWERRVRRIAPALTVTVTVSLVAAWLVLFPEDLQRFGRSLVAQSLLLSNVFFWRDSGYFDEGVVRPLLHTWSLAVEEQFYLFFPFVLVVARRLPAPWLLRSLVALSLVSFAISIYGIYWHPLPAFYLLPPRAWELLLGSLLAVWPWRAKRAWLNELLSWGGIGAILLACFTYDNDIKFPGPSALLPCLGAAAVIAGSESGQTSGGKVLAWAPLVLIGQISYSLYLWHWPVFTGAKYLFSPLGRADYVGLIALSVALAFLSWKLVEAPFRSRRLLARRRALFGLAGATTALFIAAGAWLGLGDGAPARWKPEALRYLEGKSDSDFRVELGVAEARAGRLVELGRSGAEGPIELLVWGDSHAMHVLHVVDLVCRERGLRCVAATHSSTVPLLGVAGHGPYSLRADALEYSRSLVDFVARERVPKVLLAAVWSSYHELDPELFQRAVADTARALQGSGARTYVLQDVPFPDFDVPTALSRAAQRGRVALGVSRAEHRARNAAANAVWGAQEGASLHVLDPAPAFLAGNDRYLLERDARSLYFDHHHLSTHGSLLLRPLVEGLLGPARPTAQN